MKNIMILGAGVYQLPLIKTVKQMGHRVIVVSPDGMYPGLKIADILIDADIKDKDKVLSKAIEYSIDAILTTGSDVAVPTIGYVVSYLELHGTGEKAAMKSMDKALMKKCFSQKFVKTAEFAIITSFNELKYQAKKIGYPVMVKAVDSSGSRGITMVAEEKELIDAYRSACNVSSSDEVVVEQYLEGYEIGAQAVVIGKEVVEIFLHNDTVTPPPVSVPIGHAMPLSISSVLDVKIRNLIKLSIDALGIENTISNVDIIVVDEEPYILEIGARMGGTCLAENVSIYGGFNAYEFLVRLALGEQPKLPHEYVRQANAAFLICVKDTGIVSSIDIPDLTKNHKELVELVLDVTVGDHVNSFKVGSDRIGHLLVKSSNEESAKLLAEKLALSIKIGLDTNGECSES